jgi:hypothetical protein
MVKGRDLTVCGQRVDYPVGGISDVISGHCLCEVLTYLLRPGVRYVGPDLPCGWVIAANNQSVNDRAPLFEAKVGKQVLKHRRRTK